MSCQMKNTKILLCTPLQDLSTFSKHLPMAVGHLRICVVTHFLKPNLENLGIIGQDTSVSKSNHLHVDTFHLFSVKQVYRLL